MVTDACGTKAATVPVKTTVYFTSPGDTSVFGNGAWNVYVYQNPTGNTLFTAANYKGYYTEPILNFNTTNRWAGTASPSTASGYAGCYVAPTFNWTVHKRTGFTTGVYQIDIPAHDDNVYLYINGVLVFSHIGCCDAHTNVWTGPLSANDKIEMRVFQGGGSAFSSITLSAVTPTPLTAGSITPSQHICTNNVPPSPFTELTAASGGCTISGYSWEYSEDNGVTWKTVAGATGKTWTLPWSVYAQTQVRRTVHDVCGNSASTAPQTIYLDAVPPGDPNVFGNNVWNVYLYNDVNYSLYAGYYTEPNLTFATTSRYPNTGIPSTASGYQGCQVFNTYYSSSMKRTGIPAGFYQIDVTLDDDSTTIIINGQTVTALAWPTIQNNVWRGFLSPTDKIEVRWRNTGGPGEIGLRFTQVPQSPLTPGAISASNPTLCAGDVPIIVSTSRAGNGCYPTYAWQYSTDNGGTWTTIAGATDPSYTAGTTVTVTTQFRRRATDNCGATVYSNVVTYNPSITPPGDPSVFGNGQWNVYAYATAGVDFNNAIYRGYYTETALSFISTSKWAVASSPDQATGYQGCQVNSDNHWVSYRRTNFSPGTYRIDVTAHDDPGYLLINGVEVFSHNGCCDSHAAVWTGTLGATDKVEFRWREYGGSSQGGLNLVLVSTAALTGGTIGSNQTICANAIPNPFTSTTAATGGCTFTYQWQSQNNCTGGWTNIAGANAATYAATTAITVPTCFRRMVTSACGETAYSNTLTVSMSPALTPGAISAAATACGTPASSAISSTALPTGADGNYIYQWQESTDNIGWSNISGATAASYTASGLTADRYFRRMVTACSGNAVAYTAAVLVTVKPVISINTQPNNPVACVGGNSSTAVVIAGTATSYQWQLNTGSGWSNISNNAVYAGATTAKLDFTNVTAGMAGYQYRVLITGSCAASLTSNTVTLTLSNTPVINSQPASKTICAGNSVSFALTASGSGLSYQWQERIGSGLFNNISDNASFSGTTTNTLTVNNVTTTMSSNSYQCVVTSTCGNSATSTPAVLTVVNAIINTIGSDQNLCGNAAAATLTGNAAGTYTYLWESSTVSASTGFVTAAGTNNQNNYTPSPTNVTTWYRRMVSNGACSTYSNVVVVNRAAALAISSQPTATAICAGGTANFAVSASGPGTLSYQWYEYNSGISTALADAGMYSGTQTPTLTVTGATAAMNGYSYYVRIVSSGCSSTALTSNRAVLTTNSAPVITSTAGTINYCVGTVVYPCVTATGIGLTYQWQINQGSSWSNLANYGVFGDVTTANLRIHGATANMDGYQLRVIVTGSCSPFTATSGVYTLSLLPPITNNSIENRQNYCAGGTPTPFIGSTPGGGNGSYTYQWQQLINGTWVPIPGATGKDYDPGPVTITTSYLRTVYSGNTCAGVNSWPIAITINAATSTSNPRDTITCAGTSTKFIINATGSSVTYRWQVRVPAGSFTDIADGLNYAGTQTSTLTVMTPSTDFDGYQYRCIVGGYCTPTMDTTLAAKLTVQGPIITQQPSNTSTCLSGNASFTVVATGNALSYQWREKTGSGSFVNISNGGIYSGAQTATLQLTGVTTAMHANQYVCVVTSDGCPINTQPASLSVSQQPSLVITNPAPQCVPVQVDITAAAITAGSQLYGQPLTYWTDAQATSQLSNPETITSAGTYYIRVATSPTCVDIKPVVVTINPVITNNSITASQEICSGSTPASFTGSTPGGGNGSFAFKWLNSTDSSSWNPIGSAAASDYSAPALTATTWYKRVVISGGCSDTSAAIKVTVVARATASISYGNTPYCNAGTATVTQNGQSGGTYSSTAGLSINSTTGDIDLANSNTGSYTVTYAFSNGPCNSTTTTSITINAVPVVTITNPAAVCAPATVNLRASAITAGSTAGLTFTYFTDSAATTTLANAGAVNASGRYYIKGTTAAGCSSIQPVVVTIDTTPIVSITYGNSTFCRTGTATVTRTGLAGGSYSSGNGLVINSATGEIDLLNSSAGHYTIFYSVNGGTCTGTANTSIDIDGPTLVVHDPTFVCAPGTVDLTAAYITSGSTTGLSFQYFMDAAGTITLQNPSAVYSSGTYYIRGRSANGCASDIKAVQVQIAPQPALQLTTNRTQICKGEEITIEAVAPGSSIRWQTGETSNSFVVRPAETGNYTATATSPLGCRQTETINIFVRDFKADLNVSANPVMSGYPATFTATANAPFTALAWTPASLFSQQQATSQTISMSDTSKTISVILQSPEGCLDTASVFVTITDNTKELFIPNAFTPNNDGSNDLFKVYGTSIQRIETRDKDKGWDGTYRGSPQPPGAYVYTIKIYTYNSGSFMRKGTITLMR